MDEAFLCKVFAPRGDECKALREHSQPSVCDPSTNADTQCAPGKTKVLDDATVISLSADALPFGKTEADEKRSTKDKIKDWLGAHIRVRRREKTLGIPFWHHGIVSGVVQKGRQLRLRVTHFIRRRGSAEQVIEETSLEEFVHEKEGSLEVVHHAQGQRLTVREILARARSQLGSRGYSLLSLNCEHFANWCCTNIHRSEQVRQGAVATYFLACGLLALCLLRRVVSGSR